MVEWKFWCIFASEIKSNKDMKKAILFARVSTKHQDLERQRELLMPLIKGDGYQDDEIAIIEHKESATKNDIQNRKSIQEMMELIDNESIKSVYVTEISRLGRRNDVLFEVFALLDKKKIALVVQSPSVMRTYTFDDNGNPIPNSTGLMILSILQQISVNESQIKMDRVKSGLELRKKTGHITSSKVIFGYKRSDDNRPIIDEENAKLVIEIFRLCLEGNSCGVIFKRMRLLARWNDSPYCNKVANILKDKTYIGQNPHFPYPRIIDDETFKKANEMLKSRYTLKRKTKFPYYCQKLIHWKGKTLTPVLKDGSYSISQEKKSGINIDCIDDLAKTLAFDAYSIMLMWDNNKRRASIMEARETARRKIETIDKEMKDIEKKINRIKDGYYDGDMDEKEYKFRKRKLDDEMKFLMKEKDNLNVTLLNSKDVVNLERNFILVFGKDEWLKLDDEEKDDVRRDEIYQFLTELTDDNKIIDVINKVIKAINLEKTEYGWIVRFEFNNPTINEWRKNDYYEYHKANPKIITLYSNRMGDDGKMYRQDWTGTWTKRLLNFKKERGIKQKRYNSSTRPSNPKDE